MNSPNSRRAFGNAAAMALLLGAAALHPLGALAQSTQKAPASPVTPQRVTVPTTLTDTFAMDWTESRAVAKLHDALVKMVQGHTEVRCVRNGSDLGAVSFRGETVMLADAKGEPVAKAEPVTEVFTPGQGVVYNAAENVYIKRSYADHSQIPAVMSTWMDVNDNAVYLGLGRLLPETSLTPQDGTLDGVPVRIYVCRPPLETEKVGVDTHTFQEETRYYFSRETGLPIRCSALTAEDGGPLTEYVRFDVTACKPLPTLSDDRLALAIPTTATAYAPPKRNLLAIGTPAPDFTCINADGKPLKLSDYKGKIVILDFWATWCMPCQASFPHLQRVYQHVKDRDDIVVLALCVRDEKAAYDKWRVSHKQYYSFPVAFDPAGLNSETSVPYSGFKVYGIPTQYVIGKDGNVADSLVGYMGADDHRLETTLATLGVNVPVETKTAAK